jgi:hypothetical protein
MHIIQTMKVHHVSLVVAGLLACAAFAAESPSAKGSGKEAPKAAAPAANHATIELTVTGMT